MGGDGAARLGRGGLGVEERASREGVERMLRMKSWVWKWGIQSHDCVVTQPRDQGAQVAKDGEERQQKQVDELNTRQDLREHALFQEFSASARWT